MSCGSLHTHDYSLILPDITRNIDALGYVLEFEMGVLYTDIISFADFEKLHTPQGWYWCEFFGGLSNYRCYLLPSNIRRAEFFQLPEYSALINPLVRSILDYDGITVRQDPTHAIPGFYIVAPKKAYKSVDQLSFQAYMIQHTLDYLVGEIIRTQLGHDAILRVNEERRVSHQNVHTWVLPIASEKNVSKIFDRTLLELVLTHANWRDHALAIEKTNNLLEESLSSATNTLKNFGLICDTGLHNESNESNESNDVPDSALFTTDLHDKTIGTDVIIKIDTIVVKRSSRFPVFAAYEIADEGCEYGYSSLSNYLIARMLAYFIRKSMRDQMNIEYAYTLELTTSLNNNIPITIIPIYDITKYPRIYNFAINDYIADYVKWEEVDHVAADLKLRNFLNTRDVFKAYVNVNKYTHSFAATYEPL